MGSSASKETSRKRSARESWYAPVSRSTSAPIHYIADVGADGDYLPANPFSFTEDNSRFSKDSKNSLASLLQEENLAFEESRAKYSTEKAMCELHEYHPPARDNGGCECEPRKRVAIWKACPRFGTTLNPIEEATECNNGNAITFSTHDLMKEPEEDDRCREFPFIRTTANRSVFEKSQSFNKVHALDSCFTELNLPVWQRYFTEQEIQTVKEVQSERQASNEENSLCMKQFHRNSIISSKSPSKSPSKTLVKAPEHSPLRSPLKSPTRSPSMSPSRGSNSPLFDPSLLAKFEQAVHATALLQDDSFTHSNNEGSMTTTSSSLYNNTWGLSETNSDGESPQSTLTENSSVKLGILSSWNKNVDISCELDDFEIRCPPKGEDKVVLYFTSLRGVRKTYEDCCALRRILQGFGIHVDERDVWMHSKFREELTELLDSKRLQVPRLFIKGRYIGGVEEICQLHEDGFLADLIIGMPHFGTFRKACEGCADMRFVPCFTCHGSCKVLDDLDEVLRCSECNENGLILCPICS